MTTSRSDMMLGWRRLLQADQAVELRGLAVGKARALSRIYRADAEGLAAMAAQAIAWDDAGARGVYWTLNPLRDDLVGREVAAKDSDVLSRRWLLVDVDPVRVGVEPGQPSSDAEKAEAWTLTERLRRILVTGGWPEPTVCDSGNGYHLLLPWHARNDEASKALAKAFLAGLAARCNTAGARIDTSVYNAARIVRCYGTTARKGTATAERPHRCSQEIGLHPCGSDDGQQGGAALQRMLDTWRRADAMSGGRPADSTQAYALAALKKECAAVASASEGDRNNTLNRAAFSVATLVAGGHLTQAQAVADLTQAAQACGLGLPEIQSTLASAFGAGYQHPRTVPAGKPKPASLPANPEPAGATWLAATEILQMDFPEQPCVVAGMLPIGLAILAGRPKMGKSWVAIQMGIGVATGQTVLDSTTVAGDVLYLALEDQARRIKTRLEALLGQPPYPPGLDRMAFLFSLERGDVRPLQAWLDQAQAPRLIVIDTLGRYLPARKAEAGGDAFQADYAFMGSLKELADRHNLAMLIVHHTRKADADDPLTEVSGSTAYTGAADAVLVLHRSRQDRDASLTIAGRDFEERRLDVQFQAGTWRVGGEGYQKGGGERKKSRSPRTDAAAAWLREVLAAGPRKVAEIRRMNDALPQPFSAGVLYAARDEAGVVEYQQEGRPKWWRLPTDEDSAGTVPAADTVPI